MADLIPLVWVVYVFGFGLNGANVHIGQVVHPQTLTPCPNPIHVLNVPLSEV